MKTGVLRSLTSSRPSEIFCRHRHFNRVDIVRKESHLRDLRLDLHHIGIVVADIAEKREFYTLLGYSERTCVIHDPVQTAYVQFLRLRGADHYLELVAPNGPESKLAKAASRKHPLNHLCYSVDDIAATCSFLEAHGWSLVSEITPAVAFEGRRIAWVSSPDLLIVELVERGTEGSL
jgi:methylmalonyl-CoA/ethylmalonyl-CoA epimerase